MTARHVVISLLLLTLARGAGAQSTFSGIVGATQDQSGVAVPGATITLRSVDEQTMQSLVSDAAGGFQFLNLKPGTYEIEAALSGVAEVRLQNLRLDARQTLRVNVSLAVAGLSEDVKKERADRCREGGSKLERAHTTA